MKVIFTILVFTFSLLSTFAQDRFIVYFEGKDAVEIENVHINPNKILSIKSLERREKSRIPIDSYDIPVSNAHIQYLRNAGCRIIQTSKWLNAVLVESTLSQGEIKNLTPAILSVKSYPKPSVTGVENKFVALEPWVEPSIVMTETNYGVTSTQNELLGIPCLHDEGFRGEGVLIAVLDAGYLRMDTSAVLDSLYLNGQIKATRDFWGDSAGVYHGHDHGTFVMSILAGNIPGEIVGVAPKAEFVLAITDHPITETHQDEFFWVAAMEWADSMGADIISSSLGYLEFDPNEGDYVYDDLDGNQTISAIGADIAAAKGIIVSNSAGNGGHITTPCDADSILCVGGARPDRSYDDISSTGPSADNDIKPDVAAMTRQVGALVNSGVMNINYGGTSSAAPQISGLAACLLQAHPNRSNMEIIEAIKLSGHLANAPNDEIGYGVPDACKADSLLDLIDNPVDIRNSLTNNPLHIFPNPVSQSLQIQLETNTSPYLLTAKILSVQGQVLKTIPLHTPESQSLSLGELADGIYLLEICDEKGKLMREKFIKKDSK